MKSDHGSPTDLRTQRTRAGLGRAFNGLLLTQGYDAITPALIASTAGVARSTFYAHFSGKPALLRHVLRPVLLPLAETVCRPTESGKLELVLEHFWANRRLARMVMTGRPRFILQDRLAELMEVNLKRARYELHLPPPMAAAGIAHAQIALLDFWLTRGGSATASTLAPAMRALGVASITALRR